MVKVWHTNISNSPKNPENHNREKERREKIETNHFQIFSSTERHHNLLYSAAVLTHNLLICLFFTGRILRTNEDVGCLGQPLHELGNAFCVILGLAQRAHHGTQDTTDNSCEQLRVEGFGCPRGVGCRVGPCSMGGTGGRWGWGEDGLGGLEMKWK